MRNISKSKLAIIVSGTLILGSCVVCSVITGNKTPCVLAGYDSIALPGEDVTLTAKVETDDSFGVRGDVSDEAVEFVFNGVVVSAKTGPNGFAKAVAKAPMADGFYPVQVRVKPDSSRSITRSAQGSVLVIAKDAPIAVCDIDNTLADISAVDFLLSTNEKTPVMKGSVEAMTAISARCRVVYLTHRDDYFLIKTKKWLELNKYPDGPVIFGDIPHTSTDPAVYKKKALSAIKAKWPNLLYGFGDKDSDLEAYSSLGMQSFIISEPLPVMIPGAKVQFVKDWHEIMQALSIGAK